MIHISKISPFITDHKYAYQCKYIHHTLLPVNLPYWYNEYFFSFGNNILNKKIILQKFKTATQNTPVLLCEDYTDVAAAVGLMLGACARHMYRHFYAIHLTTFSSNSSDKHYPKLLWKVINKIPEDSEKKNWLILMKYTITSTWLTISPLNISNCNSLVCIILIVLLFKKPLECNKLMYRNIKYIQNTNHKNQNTLLQIPDGRNNIKMNIIRRDFSFWRWTL